ncbi:APC family permease [Haloplanus halobius]|uniref:APC family permease n=1 Tax=Haloplanus halobius TaxID=2934938 RepID=UPI00200CF015|nr:APC family permease [Haloplanus sp. XH21]
MARKNREETDGKLVGRIGWWGAATASIGLVVASSTFSGDFNGYGIAGPGYLVTLLFGFVLNILVVFSYSELLTIFPETGQIFDFTRRGYADSGKQKAFLLATGMGTTYWLIFGLVWGSETAAGAHAMVQTTGLGSVTLWIIALNLLAMGINMLGIRLTITTATLLVVCMVSIRMAMGVAAFSGFNLLNQVGDPAVLLQPSEYRLEGMVAALPLGIWAFIGLEFATPLVNEVKDAKNNIPRGMIIGGCTILVMALTMGSGIIMTYSPAVHSEMYLGNAPQIEIAAALFGPTGRLLAGLASFAATIGSLLIAYAAIPRILYSMAREGAWPKPFAWIHPRFVSPWPATLATGAVFLVPPLISTDVVLLIRIATIVWLLTYAWVFVLVLKLRITHPHAERSFQRHPVFYVIGLCLIVLVLWQAYAGDYYLIVIAGAIFALGFAIAKALLNWRSIHPQSANSGVHHEH